MIDHGDPGDETPHGSTPSAGSSDSFDQTRVDLGDDLIEKTAILQRPSSQQGESPPPVATSPTPQAQGPEDDLESARILRGEGLWEDAKKILRRLLISVPNHAEARKLLKEIQEDELRRIFSSEAPSGPGRGGFGMVQEAPEVPFEAVLESWIRELPELEGEAIPAVWRTEPFLSHLSATVGALPAKDHEDLAIAFQEMGLFEAANRLFEELFTKMPPDSPESAMTRREVGALYSGGLLEADRALDAVAVLQPLIADAEVKEDDKVELYYQMGRARERLGQVDEAVFYLSAAERVSPGYRDAQRKVARMRGEARTRTRGQKR